MELAAIQKFRPLFAFSLFLFSIEFSLSLISLLEDMMVYGTLPLSDSMELTLCPTCNRSVMVSAFVAHKGTDSQLKNRLPSLLGSSFLSFSVSPSLSFLPLVPSFLPLP